MPTLAAVLAQLCAHGRPNLSGADGSPEAAVWEAAGEVLDNLLSSCPAEAGAELLRVLAEGAIALHFANPSAAAACPAPLCGGAAGRLRRAHATAASSTPPPPQPAGGGAVLDPYDPAEAEALRRVALKRQHNDALEECLENMRRVLGAAPAAAAEQPPAAHAPESVRSNSAGFPVSAISAAAPSEVSPHDLGRQKAWCPESTQAVRVTVLVRLGAVEEEHVIAVKQQKYARQIVAAFCDAFDLKYGVDIRPLRPALAHHGSVIGEDTALGAAGVRDGDVLHLIPLSPATQPPAGQ